MTLDFDPNQASSWKNGVFGLPCSEENSQVIYLAIPWDVTTSYQNGAAKGPEAILKSSDQIDFFDLDFNSHYQNGFFMRPSVPWIEELNQTMRAQALKVMESQDQKALDLVNRASAKLNSYVEKECKNLLTQNKTPILVGGDHSVPFGAIKAYSEHYQDLGILHIDAHSDTRRAYMGFKHSHASIMYNVMEECEKVSQLTQVAIRDFCEEEYQYIQDNKKVKTFFDSHLQADLCAGRSFDLIAKAIVETLPKNVYLSLDIDGLDPKYCPNTGTPVPGGLSFNQVIHLIKVLISSKRTLVGFDLVEISPGQMSEWDANVGMRLLYKLTNACLLSQRTQA